MINLKKYILNKLFKNKLSAQPWSSFTEQNVGIFSKEKKAWRGKKKERMFPEMD